MTANGVAVIFAFVIGERKGKISLTWVQSLCTIISKLVYKPSWVNSLNSICFVGVEIVEPDWIY